MSFKFEDNSERVKNALQSASEEGMEAALLIIEAQAKALTPVGNTGALRDKIDHEVSRENGAVIGKVGSPLEYALYVEFGTGLYAENGAGRKGGWVYKDSSGEWFTTYGQDPQPFLRPAFRRNKKAIQAEIGNAYKAKF